MTSGEHEELSEILEVQLHCTGLATDDFLQLRSDD